MAKNEVKFGDSGTKDWFGGLAEAARIISFTLQLVDDRRTDLRLSPNEWPSRNARAALTRREALPADHPFRADDEVLKFIAAGWLDLQPTATFDLWTGAVTRIR